MALDVLTSLTILLFTSGLTLSSYVGYLIIFVIGEEFHMPVMFMGGCWLVFITWIIGAHWDFRPELFPRGFCVTSSLIYNFGAFCCTSVGMTLCITTYNAVNAARRRDFDTLCRPWAIPPKLKIFFYAYPCAALSVFASLALSFDAIGPEGKWICDVTRKDYLWIRLFGYGGIDVLATLPACIASCLTMRILVNIHTDTALIDQIQGHFNGQGNNTVQKGSPEAAASDEAIQISLASPTASPMASPRSQMRSIAPLSPAGKIRYLHEAESTSTHETVSDSTYPPRTFSDPPWRQHAGEWSNRRTQIAFTTDSRRLHRPPGPEAWASDATIIEPSPTWEPQQPVGKVAEAPSPAMPLEPATKPDFKVALLRILYLDFLFTGIEALAAVSSLRAVVRNSPPAGYDTAFAAIICASWGPFLLLGSTPMILDHMIPGWRRLLPR